MTAIPMSVDLPFAFIDYYLPRCEKPFYVLIYIYSLRMRAAAFSPKEVGQVFDVTEAEVREAWQYWEDAGLIRLEPHGEWIGIVFLPVGPPESKQTPPPQTREIKPVPAGRPQYTVDELTVLQKNEEIAQLFSLAEQSLGKMLTYNDMNLLFGFYDWLRLPVDVIGYLLSHCADSGHRDMRYIEKAALDWADKEIDDMEKALAYVQTFDRDYREILRVMGQTSGYPTPSQRKYIGKWLREYKLPAALVFEACDKAAAQIGKPKFTYVDKILDGWHKKGITTLAEVEADAAEFERSKAEGIVKENARTDKKPAKNSRYVNFKQREWDYDKLEKLEREYILKQLKG